MWITFGDSRVKREQPSLSGAFSPNPPWEPSRFLLRDRAGAVGAGVTQLPEGLCCRRKEGPGEVTASQRAPWRQDSCQWVATRKVKCEVVTWGKEEAKEPEAAKLPLLRGTPHASGGEQGVKDPFGVIADKTVIPSYKGLFLSPGRRKDQYKSGMSSSVSYGSLECKIWWQKLQVRKEQMNIRMRVHVLCCQQQTFTAWCHSWAKHGRQRKSLMPG